MPVATDVGQQRQRSHRWRLVVIVGVVIVAVAAGLVVQRSSDGGTDAVVVVPVRGDRTDRFALVDLDSSTVRNVRIPGLVGWASRQDPFVQTDGRFVYLEKPKPRELIGLGGFPTSRVFSYPDDFRGSRVVLGQAHRIVASGRPGRAWLVTVASRSLNSQGTAQEVDVVTGEAGREWQLDGDPTVGVDDGLLLRKRDGSFALWTPPHRERMILPAGTARYGGITGHRALFGIDCKDASLCTELRLIDLRTGDSRTVHRPRGVALWVLFFRPPRAPLIPDGEHIALPVKLSAERAWPWFVVDSRGRLLHRFDGVQSALASPDDRWVVVQLRDSLVAYRLADGRTRTVRAEYNPRAIAVARR